MQKTNKNNNPTQSAGGTRNPRARNHTRAHTHTNNEWIQLKDKKAFSRILYTNPVCFLTTTNMNGKISTSATATTTNDDDDDDYNDDDVVIPPTRNVMVVSWLTATNNSGRFMMSINKRRHTSTILATNGRDGDHNGDNNHDNNGDDNDNNDKGAKEASNTSINMNMNIKQTEFVLCVPVAGMEDLVLKVGKTSGRWGRSKLPSDYVKNENDNNDNNNKKNDNVNVNDDNNDKKNNDKGKKVNNDNDNNNEKDDNNIKIKTPNKEKKKRKYRPKYQFVNDGIEGLIAVKLGTSDEEIDIHGNVNINIRSNTNGNLRNDNNSKNKNERTDANGNSTSSNNDNDNDHGNNEDVGVDIDMDSSSLFAIKGTVAHLKCKLYDILSAGNDTGNDTGNDNDMTYPTSNPSPSPIDDEHHLILGEIEEAYVHSNYWDKQKRLFLPREGIIDHSNEDVSSSSNVPAALSASKLSTSISKTPPPYLTFFGSQSFGYVCTKP